jgi:hypothetical protein
VAEFSTTVRTRSLNQASTPRLTSTPKNRATITAGATAATENRPTNRRCRRAPASLARASTRSSSRQPTMPAMQTIRARLKPRTTRMTVVAGPIGPVAGGDEARNTAVAVRAMARP